MPIFLFVGIFVKMLTFGYMFLPTTIHITSKIRIQLIFKSYHQENTHNENHIPRPFHNVIIEGNRDSIPSVTFFMFHPSQI